METVDVNALKENIEALEVRVKNLEAKTSSGDSSFLNSIPFVGKSSTGPTGATGSTMFDSFNPFKKDTGATGSADSSIMTNINPFKGGRSKKRKRSKRYRSRRR